MRDLIRQKIVDALAMPVPVFTRRTVRLPGVPGKALAVIGPRRAGKTTFLWQVLADRLESGTAPRGPAVLQLRGRTVGGDGGRRTSVGRRGVLRAQSAVAGPPPGRVLLG